MEPKSEPNVCTPIPIQFDSFNAHAVLPYGLELAHIRSAMTDFIDFLGFINHQLHTKHIPRLESMLMPANFSSIVGEFIISTIPKYTPQLVKNRHHNGHPDLVPTSWYPNNAVLHGADGIEVKASRYTRGWQGHNPEHVWLMIFVFDSNRPNDNTPRPFQFLTVAGAQLEENDWKFSGRSESSRRTITASVTRSGYDKMMKNWIYKG
jgi:hypothetical protein